MRLALTFIFVGIASLSLAAEKASCVFCEIAAGHRNSSRVVYRDDTVIAFVDRAPRNPGHVLVIPVEHADSILEVSTASANHMLEVVQRIAIAVKKTDIKAEGFNLISNNGAAAGQTMYHFHIHLIPRYAGEPPDMGERRIAPNSELDAMAEKIRSALKQEPNKARQHDAGAPPVSNSPQWSGAVAYRK